MVKALEPESLRLLTDPASLPAFETTATLAEPAIPPGQDRAVRALHFGAGMVQPGYNLFVTGSSGTGKQAAVQRALTRLAAAMAAPSDVAYVHNFAAPDRPTALLLPAGEGAKLRAAMAALAAALKEAMPRLLADADYRRARAAIEDEFHAVSERAFTALRSAAEQQGLALVEETEGSFDFRPARDGLPLNDSAYRALSREERNRLEAARGALRAQLDELLQTLDDLRLKMRERLRRIERERGGTAIRALLANAEAALTSTPALRTYFDTVRSHALSQLDRLLAVAGDKAPETPLHVDRYDVNLLVANASGRGAPIITLALPSLAQLVGTIEPAQSGSAPDFHSIRSGALHRANGGFLLVDAAALLRSPRTYDALKRALKTRSLGIDGLAETTDRAPAAAIRPEPVSLDIKVVLFGDNGLYQRLRRTDPDFAALFKVQVDFAQTGSRDAETAAGLLGTMAALARAERIRHLDRVGAARFLDEAARRACDARKLSLRTDLLADLLREADHFAAVGGRSVIVASDIDRAIAGRDYRLGRLKADEHEHFGRRLLRIETKGVEVGQANALTVVSSGSATFGMPVRVSAQVKSGDGRVVDIERAADMSSPAHAKGVQIIAGYLAGAYGRHRPLSIAAGVAFEQTYCRIDGDSASAAELAAILSAIAQVPIRQSIAITGSVDQHGRLQTVGGINEKIEGFFDVCALGGLTGEHGIVIPRANAAMLMLRIDLVEAVRQGRFAVFAVETIDEAMEVLTGLRSGTVKRNGDCPRGTFNRRVQDRLLELARPRLMKPVHLDAWWRF